MLLGELNGWRLASGHTGLCVNRTLVVRKPAWLAFWACLQDAVDEALSIVTRGCKNDGIVLASPVLTAKCAGLALMTDKLAVREELAGEGYYENILCLHPCFKVLIFITFMVH